MNVQMDRRQAPKAAERSSSSSSPADPVQKKAALRQAGGYAEQAQMLAPEPEASPIQMKKPAKTDTPEQGGGNGGGNGGGEQAQEGGGGGGMLGKAKAALGKVGNALKNPKAAIYDARLGKEGRQEEVLGDGHDIPNQDIILEQLAHSGAYGRLDPNKLAAWGYQEAGASQDPESGFRAVLYVPTEEALSGKTPQGKIIQATHGGKPPPVLAFRGTSENRGMADDANRQGIGTYQFSCNETRVADMLGAAGDKCIVTGHSLGGALAQLAATHFPGMVKRVVTFQSPGINKDEADKLKKHNANAKPEDQITSTHHRAEGDIVHTAGEALTEGDVYTHKSVGVGNAMDHMSFPLARLAAARGDMIPGVNDDKLGAKGGDKLVSIDKTTTDKAKGGLGTRIAEGGRKAFGGVLRDDAMETYAIFWKQIKEMIASGVFPPKQILAIIKDTDKLTPDQKIKMRDQADAMLKAKAAPKGKGKGDEKGKGNEKGT